MKVVKSTYRLVTSESFMKTDGGSHVNRLQFCTNVIQNCKVPEQLTFIPEIRRKRAFR